MLWVWNCVVKQGMSIPVLLIDNPTDICEYVTDYSGQPAGRSCRRNHIVTTLWDTFRTSDCHVLQKNSVASGLDSEAMYRLCLECAVKTRTQLTINFVAVNVYYQICVQHRFNSFPCAIGIYTTTIISRTIAYHFLKCHPLFAASIPATLFPDQIYRR